MRFTIIFSYKVLYLSYINLDFSTVRLFGECLFLSLEQEFWECSVLVNCIIFGISITQTIWQIHKWEKRVLEDHMCLVVQSRQTFCDPVDCSPPGSTVHGNSPSKNTELGCHALSRGPSQPRDQTQVSSIAGRFFTDRATRETLKII